MEATVPAAEILRVRLMRPMVRTEVEEEVEEKGEREKEEVK
jgi:hypothetical protein